MSGAMRCLNSVSAVTAAVTPFVSETMKGLIGRGSDRPKDVFNATAWEEATSKVQEAYENQGYIYASIRPVTASPRNSQPQSIAKAGIRHVTATAPVGPSRASRRK